MKAQWIIVCGLILALFTAIVAVFNVEPVTLSYFWGEAKVSLIVLISASILIGGIIVALFGTVRPYMLNKEKGKLQNSNQQLKEENSNLQEKLKEIESAYSLLIKEKREEQSANEKVPPGDVEKAQNEVASGDNH